MDSLRLKLNWNSSQLKLLIGGIRKMTRTETAASNATSISGNKNVHDTAVKKTK